MFLVFLVHYVFFLSVEVDLSEGLLSSIISWFYLYFHFWCDSTFIRRWAFEEKRRDVMSL